MGKADIPGHRTAFDLAIKMKTALLILTGIVMVATAVHADVWYYDITNNIGRIDVLKMGPFVSQAEAEQKAQNDRAEGFNVGPCFSETGNIPSVPAISSHIALMYNFEDVPDQARLDKIKQTASVNPKPEIPEEARGHFIKAGTLLKEAKEQSDYELAANEYLTACNLAPWWPDVYYNLASVREAEKQYDRAIFDLNLYLASNPGDARAAQDKLYQIQAEKDLAAKHAADEQAAAAKRAADEQAAKAKETNFVGKWYAQDGDVYFIQIFGSPGDYTARLGKTSITQPIQNGGGSTSTTTFTLSNFRVQDRKATFRVTGVTPIPGYPGFSDSEDYDLDLSESGKTLSGTFLLKQFSGSQQFYTGTKNFELLRHDY